MKEVWMLGFNISFKERLSRLIDNPKKGASLLVIYAVLMGGGAFVFSYNQDGGLFEDNKFVGKESFIGEILGSQEGQEPSPVPSIVASLSSTLSPTLTPVPSPTAVSDSLVPTPVPTNVSQASQTFGVDDGNDSGPTVYSGGALAAASEKKELLVISDDLPSGWSVEKDEGTSFVSGKVGQALKIDDGGSLVLSGEEIFTAAGTLSFWLKPGWDASYPFEMPILDWNYDGSDNVSSLFEFSWAGDVFLFTMYDEEQNQEGIGEAKRFETVPGDWQYIVLTWDLTSEPFEIALYINGEKVESGPMLFVPSAKTPSNFIIGGTLLNRKSAAFIIDEVVMTNWAKNEEEITSSTP